VAIRKLLLIYPSWSQNFGEYKGAAKSRSIFPPLNLAYIASIAEQCGWEAKIIDNELEELSDEQLLKKVEGFKPDLIGLTATTPFFHCAKQIATSIKKSFDIPIILGGVHATYFRQKVFHNVFDYFFIGECENTLPAFLNSFANGHRGLGIMGIMGRDNGRVSFTGETPMLKDLVGLSWPARHLLKNDKYFTDTLRGRKNFTVMFTTRGCPFKCVYCAGDYLGYKVRRRPVVDVVGELCSVVNDLGIEHVYFYDDNFTINRNYVFDLCDRIKLLDLKFTFEVITRGDMWDEEIVKRLKECGLIRVSFGLETADPRVREIIGKGSTPLEAYIEANRVSNKYGIETVNTVQLGLPGDTRESIQATVDFLTSRKARSLHFATFAISVPLPGTEMYRMAKEGRHGLKLLTEDYSKYQRYGASVMEVNGLKPDDLLKLQHQGLIKIYSCWWRIIPVLRRFGLKLILSLIINEIKKWIKE